MGHDHLINIATLGGHEWREETLFVIFGFGGNGIGIADIRTENDFDRALGAHNGDLGGGPSEIDIAA